MNINESKFCVVPFVQLNTRGKGDARVCCSIGGLDYGIPKHITIDEINNETYGPDTEVFNLSKDNIQDLWNSKFMHNFRMKMLSGENISNCEFCHRMESSGLTSKRIGKNKRFLEKTKPFLEKYYNDNGYVDIMPQWWEIRLSTKCNLSCIMCTPGLSSMMYNEFSKWEKEGTINDIMQGSLDIAKQAGEEYLSRSEFFKQQIMDNLEHCAFMEFRGGEVFADQDSIKFIDTIGNTEYAKNIQLDISSNTTLINNKIINILNNFAGGTLRFSIDAYKDEDEYIRVHTKWNSVIRSMEHCNKLHDGWRFLTQTTVQFLNCLSMDKLITFFNDFIFRTNTQRFFLGFTTVRGKDHLRHEMVSKEERQLQIDKLQQLKTDLPIFTDHNNSDHYLKAIDMLISTLSASTYNKKNLDHIAKQYFDKLTELRGLDYYSKFPQLARLYE